MKKAITVLFLFTAIFASCMAAGEDVMERRILVTGNTGRVIFELNDSDAAESLWNQLPLEAEVSNFSNNEKIFYPDDSLNTANTPIAEGGTGTLAYYRPWGNVVMFYGPFSSNGSLYGLGEAVDGKELIPTLSGMLRIDKEEQQ